MNPPLPFSASCHPNVSIILQQMFRRTLQLTDSNLSRTSGRHINHDVLNARCWKRVSGCITQGRDKTTLCSLPVDPLDAVGSAMAHVDEKIADLAEEIILHILVSPVMLAS
jgi:hypothetical protein